MRDAIATVSSGERFDSRTTPRQVFGRLERFPLQAKRKALYLFRWSHFLRKTGVHPDQVRGRPFPEMLNGFVLTGEDMARGFFVPHDLAAPVRGAAQGSLAGLTCVVKDMYDIAGERTGAGNPDWLATQDKAAAHAAAVRRLLDAGATIVGKAVCDEFFYSVAGVNAHYGTPENVRAPGRLPGGSSSGSAAATAADICDFALGSDTGGSVRIPASLCGLYGMRPTHRPHRPYRRDGDGADVRYDRLVRHRSGRVPSGRRGSARWRCGRCTAPPSTRRRRRVCGSRCGGC
jgi:Amidase